MKIGYFSDLHTEFLKPEAVLTPKERRLSRIISLETFSEMMREAYKDADVIVAAGDIGAGEKSVRFLADTFQGKPTIFTPGNHDYWTGEIYSTQRKMRAAAEGTSVHVMTDGESIEIDGVLFVAATLWTDYELTDSRYTMSRAEDLMNDFRKIRLRRRSGTVFNKTEIPYRLKPVDLLGFHRSHLKRILDAMQTAADRDMPLVVVTHHAPSAWSLVSDYDRPMMKLSGVRPYGYADSDPYYASHLDHLMEGRNAPQVWIHGHTHIAVDYMVGKCRVVSNPKGYADGDDTDWLAGRTIEVHIGDQE